MIQRSEHSIAGVLAYQIIDYGDGTGERTEYAPDGTITAVIQLSGLPVFQFDPLNATGALATLLVVTGSLELQDAANAIHEEPEHLIAEAQAWSLG